MMSQNTARMILIATLLVFSNASRSEPSDLNQIDSILDRLEKRLLDQEAEGLSFGEKEAIDGTIGYEKSPDAKIKGKKVTVDGTLESQERMRNLAKVIRDLENQVDQLASSVQKTKQGILDDSAVDNFVTFEAQLSDTEAASIKTLNVKLDGYPLYEMSEASGLWMPSKSVPLYAGPLQPGNHRVDVEARIVVKHKKALPMNGDVYRFVNKSFDVAITSGTNNNRYVITIIPPEKIDGTAEATMKGM
jgi:hypothetical protein